MHDAALDFWFDFASTYSYLAAAAHRRRWLRRPSVQVRFRPFLLGPIFKAQGWDTSPFNLYQAKGRYMWRDMNGWPPAFAAVPPPGPFSAEQPAGGARRAARPDGGLGRRFLRRGFSRAIRRGSAGSTSRTHSSKFCRT